MLLDEGRLVVREIHATNPQMSTAIAQASDYATAGNRNEAQGGRFCLCEPSGGARHPHVVSYSEAIREAAARIYLQNDKSGGLTLGFETEADAKTAAPLIKKAAASKKK